MGKSPRAPDPFNDPWTVSEAGAYTAALLEVLDPEQNHTFNDDYLEV